MSIVQGSDKANLTAVIINPLTTLGARQMFLRTGIYAKGKDDIFNLYSDESWKNEIGLNASLILKPEGSVFYDKTETAAIREKRILFADSIRAEKYKYFTQENIKIIQQRKILAKIIEIRTKWVKDGATSEYPTYKSIESKFEEELPNDNTITKCRNLIHVQNQQGVQMV
ncbi:hypothetical protein ACNKXS_13510 [Christiangramia marina]|uniref:hypothetical protein n=1 Tax=Christiangramia marina TaxID=409436 RepID=UPI003AA9019F